MLARPSTAAFPFLRLDPLAAVLRANQCKCVNELTKSLRTHSAESARAALPAAGMARDQGGGSCLAGRFSAGLCGGRIPQLRPNQGRMHESSRVSPLHRVTRENPWGFLRPNLTKMKLFMPDRRDVTLVGLIVVSNEGPRVARSATLGFGCGIPVGLLTLGWSYGERRLRRCGGAVRDSGRRGGRGRSCRRRSRGPRIRRRLRRR